jgi:hypothetical protein
MARDPDSRAPMIYYKDSNQSIFVESLDMTTQRPILFKSSMLFVKPYFLDTFLNKSLRDGATHVSVVGIERFCLLLH